MAEPKHRVVYSTDPTSETPRPAVAHTPPARQQQVRVHLERKGRGGKSVSLISGVTPAELEKVCKLLKTRLGTGGAVKEQLIEIQGDQRDKVVAILLELGYQAKKAGG